MCKQIIIMDQLCISTNKQQLSSVFENKYRKHKLFEQIIENQHLMIALTAYLQVSELLNLCLTSKEVKQIIDKKPIILNRILRAQVKYLSQQQQVKLQYSPLTMIKNRNAYSMFESFWGNSPITIQERVSRMQNIKGSPSLVVFQCMLNKLQPIEQLKKKVNKKFKQIQSKSQQSVPSSSSTIGTHQKLQVFSDFQIEQYYKNDPELRKITQWQKRREQKQFIAKLKNHPEAPREQYYQKLVKEKAAQKMKQRQIKDKYFKVLEPNQSLIAGRESFWDRIKKKIRQNVYKQ